MSASMEKRRVGPWLVLTIVLGTVAGFGVAYGVHKAFFAPEFSYKLFLQGFAKVTIHRFIPFLFPDFAPAFARVLDSLPEWKTAFLGSLGSGWVMVGWMTRGLLTKRDDVTVIRGATLHKNRDGASRFARDTAPPAEPMTSRAVRLFDKARAGTGYATPMVETPKVDFVPGVPFDEDLWSTHVIMYGSTGSGKTTVIRSWLNNIVKRDDDKLLLFDVKSDFIQYYDLHIIDPSDSRTLYWDIARDIRTPAEAENFAAILNAAAASGKGEVWDKAASAVVAGMMIKLQKTKIIGWTWGDLGEEVLKDSEAIREDLATYAPEKLNAMPEADVTQAGVAFNLAAGLISVIAGIAAAYRLLELSEDFDRRKISLREWVSTDAPRYKKITFRVNGSVETQSKAFIASAIDYVARFLKTSEMALSPKVKTWVVGDEFANLPTMPNLQAILTVGREKGMRLIIGTQQPSQIKEKYREAFHVYKDQPGITIVGKSGGDSAEELSRFLGHQDIAKATETTSMGLSGQSSSRSYQETTRALVHPADLAKIGKHAGGIRAYAKVGGSVYLLSWPFQGKQTVREAEIRWTHQKTEFALYDKTMSDDVAAGKSLSEIARSFKANRGGFDGQDFLMMLRLRGLYVGTKMPKVNDILAAFGSLTLGQAREAHGLHKAPAEAKRLYLEGRTTKPAAEAKVEPVVVAETVAATPAEARDEEEAKPARGAVENFFMKSLKESKAAVPVASCETPATEEAPAPKVEAEATPEPQATTELAKTIPADLDSLDDGDPNLCLD